MKPSFRRFSGVSSAWVLSESRLGRHDIIVRGKVSDFRGSLGMGREVTQERRGEVVAWGTKGTHSWGPRATHSWVVSVTHEWVAKEGYTRASSLPYFRPHLLPP